ncbi:MAG: SGNH/GDSL hydrolase family protein [Chthoniobacteraceae bacterium]
MAWALDLTPQGSTIVVQPGTYDFNGTTVNVSKTVLSVAPSPTTDISGETVELGAAAPSGYGVGTPLAGCDAHGISAQHAFVPGSLVLRRASDNLLLTQGSDYLLDSTWGHLGLGLSSRVTTSTALTASYSVSKLRLDTIQISPSGVVSLKAGPQSIATPQPPAPDAGSIALAHVFVNYRDTSVTADSIYLIDSTAAEAPTATTHAGALSRVIAKLKARQPVRIVCLGDSVTAGSSASSTATDYVSLFTAGLQAKYPKTKITVIDVGEGGSNSNQWLYPGKYPYKGVSGAKSLANLKRVLDARPDLVTIEFVNDAGFTTQQTNQNYRALLTRLAPTHAQIILLTPNFTMWSLMGFTSMRDTDQRPYVLALRRFAKRHGVALADAAARWQHLSSEGIPYLTLLANTVNHPDDQGHELYYEELMKCFEPAP